MFLKAIKSRAALVAVAASLVCASSASAQWTINRPGSYKLYNNYSVARGNAIIITASNVTLDLNGFSATTTANATTTAPAPGPNGTRGITVMGARNVEIKNGKVSGFNANVLVMNSSNVRVDGLQITGGNLAPAGGPTEVGITIFNSSACDINNNTIHAVNLGLFVRGGGSSGNRLMKNIVTGGTITGNNLLGICYNPDGAGTPAGPQGDSIYNNHIARYGYAIAVSAGSMNNMFNDNTLASFTGAFREPNLFAAQGGTNVEFDNTAVTLTAPVAPAAPAAPEAP
jgi:Right handed beta helix region